MSKINPTDRRAAESEVNAVTMEAMLESNLANPVNLALDINVKTPVLEAGATNEVLVAPTIAAAAAAEVSLDNVCPISVNATAIVLEVVKLEVGYGLQSSPGASSKRRRLKI